LLGIAIADRWSEHAERVKGALASFKRLTDPRALNVKQKRIQVVELDRGMTLAQFAKRFKASVPLETLALINHVEPDSRLTPGQPYKVVTGGPKTP